MASRSDACVTTVNVPFCGKRFILPLDKTRLPILGGEASTDIFTKTGSDTLPAASTDRTPKSYSPSSSSRGYLITKMAFFLRRPSMRVALNHTEPSMVYSTESTPEKSSPALPERSEEHTSELQSQSNLV